MKIYTKTGDTGTTSLIGGTRIGKDYPLVEAYGEIDELCSLVGLLHSLCGEPMLQQVQRDLFQLGSHIASSFSLPFAIGTGQLEDAIDTMQARLPRIDRFVLPGGAVASSLAHVCRTTTRRVERRAVGLKADGVSPNALAYLNRLSDYFFVLARYLNFIEKKEENLL